MLRDGGGQNLREHLIAAAARLIDQRGSAGLAVRDIAREAQVADGVLYNYFQDKEDLLAHALLAHVGAVMASAPQPPPAGTGTVPENLRLFIERGLATLVRVMPAFAGLLSQPKVLRRFHTMVGGDAAFGAAPDDGEDPDRHPHQNPPSDAGPRGLPEILTAYLHAEQRLGRIDPAADLAAATNLIMGAIHGQILPRVLFNPPGSPITIPPALPRQLAKTIFTGIAPGTPNP